MSGRLISTWWLVVAGCVGIAAIGCSKSDSKSGAKKSDENAEESAPAKPQPPVPKLDTEATKAPAAAGTEETAPPVPPAAPAGGGAPETGSIGEKTVEVEIFGSIKGQPKTGKLLIYAAVGDCLADDAKMLEKIPGGETFMIEVFAPWGSDITVCAAVDPGNGKPPVYYGKWKDPLHAEGEGEVMFRDLVIKVAKHKPHVFPDKPRPSYGTP